MNVNNLQADIVVSVSGGTVNGVFGPEGATLLVVDFDNIRQGDEPSVCEVDGTPNSKACRETVQDAIDMIERREARQS